MGQDLLSHYCSNLKLQDEFFGIYFIFYIYKLLAGRFLDLSEHWAKIALYNIAI